MHLFSAVEVSCFCPAPFSCPCVLVVSDPKIPYSVEKVLNKYLEVIMAVIFPSAFCTLIRIRTEPQQRLNFAIREVPEDLTQKDI